MTPEKREKLYQGLEGYLTEITERLNEGFSHLGNFRLEKDNDNYSFDITYKKKWYHIKRWGGDWIRVLPNGIIEYGLEGTDGWGHLIGESVKKFAEEKNTEAHHGAI